MRIRSIGLAAGAFATLMLATMLPGPAAADSVSTPPASWTPSLATGGADGTVEQIRQLVPCGGMMYAVGTFTSIRQGGGAPVTRNNAFSFNETTGAISAWNPNVNGKVNSIALSAGCGTAYLGGVFQTVGGVNATNIAAVSTSTSALIPGFAHTAAGQVNALLLKGTHLLVGGFFTSINGSSRDYLVSLNPADGTDDGYVNLNISGTYQFVDDDGTASGPNTSRVYNFALSPDGTKVLAMGVFTSVGGQPRRQIFMLDLGLLGATLNPWYSAEFDQNCDVLQPYWLQDAAWSPDGSKIYIATTGFRPATGPAHNQAAPRSGLCDAAAAFTATGTATRLWISYTGCDSLFSIAADATSVYVGGHNRWMSNSGCGFRAVGSVDAPGMAVLSAFNGAVSYNPTRSRGIGATDMLITAAGLWIASDNLGASTQCAGVTGFSGICFLPKAKGTALTDYNADGRADNAVFRPSNGTWYTLGAAPVVLGRPGDVPQVGNFTGDAKPDPTVWRPSTGHWYVNGVGGSTQWGASSDKPVAGNYDGDPAADFTVWRPSTGKWYVHPDPAGTAFGAPTDIPVPGDYNGDGKTDIAVWRPSNGNWYVKVNGVNQPGVPFGQNGDKPIVADFSGDGIVDIAVWRPANGTWYVRGGVPGNKQWGLSTDIPTAGDFTGDGRADFAVWRPLNGFWFVAAPAPAQTQWGKSGDVPLHAFR